MAEYTKQTDEVHIITLESKITNAMWCSSLAPIEEKANFEVWTQFVGNGSEIQIKVQDKRGKTIEMIKGQVYGNYFGGSIIVPEKAEEELSFTAKLPKHGLEKKSGILRVIPPILVTNMKWGQKEARRGDVVKLTADVKGVPADTEAVISIFEYDQDAAHDFITKFPTKIMNNKIEKEWEFEYHEDIDEMPTEEELQQYGQHYNPPEYFFIVVINGQRFGEKQESGLLKFKDYVEIELKKPDGNPVPNKKYTLLLSDGSEIEGILDDNGYAIEKDIPPGKVRFTFPQE